MKELRLISFSSSNVLGYRVLEIRENYILLKLKLKFKGSFTDELNMRIQIPKGILTDGESVQYEDTMMVNIKIKQPPRPTVESGTVSEEVAALAATAVTTTLRFLTIGALS